MGVLADLTNEVGGAAGGELGSAAGLVGPLSAGEGLTADGGDGLPLFREAVDLYVDVGVGGSHNDERRRRRRVR